MECFGDVSESLFHAREYAKEYVEGSEDYGYGRSDACLHDAFSFCGFGPYEGDESKSDGGDAEWYHEVEEEAGSCVEVGVYGAGFVGEVGPGEDDFEFSCFSAIGGRYTAPMIDVDGPERVCIDFSPGNDMGECAEKYGGD